jgi:mRNA-degrading endonuclease toxin of MazEF toxin-antitoxin module
MIYNRRTSKAIAFPITTKVKGYKFEVPLPEGLSTTVSFCRTTSKCGLERKEVSVY